MDLNLTCTFDLCIYQEDGKCTLNEISINNYGMCDEAIVITLPEDELSRLKQKHRSDLDDRQNI